MPTDRKLRILRRTEFISLDGEERAVFYKKTRDRDYSASYPGVVSRNVQTWPGSVDDYVIDVIEDGERIRSYSAREWLQCYPNTKWQREKHPDENQ